MGGDELINSVTSLDVQFNIIIDTMETYRLERAQMLTSITPETMTGLIGSVNPTEKQMASLRPIFAGLEPLLTQTLPFAETLVQDCFLALKALAHAERSPFKKTFRVQVPTPDGDQVTLRASDGRKLRAAKRRNALIRRLRHPFTANVEGQAQAS